jgi:hypothetical protein
MWKASAIRANEPTATPTPSSNKKNAASIASMTVIRVDFDHAMLKMIWPCMGMLCFDQLFLTWGQNLL